MHIDLDMELKVTFKDLFLLIFPEKKVINITPENKEPIISVTGEEWITRIIETKQEFRSISWEKVKNA